jgi:hypothetical protein
MPIDCPIGRCSRPNCKVKAGEFDDFTGYRAIGTGYESQTFSPKPCLCSVAANGHSKALPHRHEFMLGT